MPPPVGRRRRCRAPPVALRSRAASVRRERVAASSADFPSTTTSHSGVCHEHSVEDEAGQVGSSAGRSVFVCLTLAGRFCASALLNEVSAVGAAGPADAEPTTGCEEQNMAQGTVKWFNGEKGYGFIAQDNNAADVFVHYSEINAAGFRSLEEGQRVEFEIGQGAKGPQATGVRVV
jgi:cold shock protein